MTLDYRELRQHKPGGAMAGHYAGQLLELSPDVIHVVACATFRRLGQLYRDPNRQLDARIDRVDPRRHFDQWFTGYMGEAAYGVRYGLPITGMLDDKPGRPDYVHASAYIDVKTVVTGSTTTISVREDVLDRPRLELWRLVGAKHTIGSSTVTLLGWLPMGELYRYPRRPAAYGHDKAYIAVPMADLRQLP